MHSMAFNKIGESLVFNPHTDILKPRVALGDKKIQQRFIKMAKKLKKIAPKANDFLYFSAIMMHSAEASLVDQTTGEAIKNASGSPVVGYFEKFTNKKGQESLRWISPDGIKPYANANKDIFPEEQLKIAYKKWVGKSLCKDHKSDSVDGIRGIIIDTYYDPRFKRVHALCALDKKNYSDLARKVETGYANSVSMGTAVGRSICTECGNIAISESDYCNCVRNRIHHGEINLDLNPIELSLVVNGADGLAKVRQVIASMHQYVQNKSDRIEQLKSDRCVNPAELQDICDSIKSIEGRINSLMSPQVKQAATMGETAKAIEVLQSQLKLDTDPKTQELVLLKLKELIGDINTDDVAVQGRPTMGGGDEYFAQNADEVDTPMWANRLASNKSEKEDETKKEISLLKSKIEAMVKSIDELKTGISKEEKLMNSARIKARARARRAYLQGGGGVGDPKSLPYKKDSDPRNEDKQMVGKPLNTGKDGLHPGDEKTLAECGRDALNLDKKTLEDRKMKRRAYWQGGGGANEPQTYPKEDYEAIRATDRQMTGTKEMGSVGMVPGDLEIKEKMLRTAKLKARFVKANDRGGSRWDFFANDQLILSATAKEAYEDEKTINENWDYVSSPQYGKDVMAHIRNHGLKKVAYLLKGAADEEPAVAATPTPSTPVAADQAAQIVGGNAPTATDSPDEIVAPTTTEVAPATTTGVRSEEINVSSELGDKLNAALSAIEEKISEIRDIMTGAPGAAAGTDSGLVELDISSDATKPVDKALAAVASLLDGAADELAIISEGYATKMSAPMTSKMDKIAKLAILDSRTILAKADDVIESAKIVVADQRRTASKKRAIALDYELSGSDMGREYAPMMTEMEAPVDKDEIRELMREVRMLKHQLMQKNKKSLKEDEADDNLEMMVLDSAKAEEDSVECEECEEIAATEKTAVSRNELIAKAEKILDKYMLDLGKADVMTEPTVEQAHPKNTMTKLTDTKTDGARIERIDEAHAIIREVAESDPRSVREAAARLNEMVVDGQIKLAEIDSMVIKGEVDQDCVSYFKKYFAQAGDAGSFGEDLSKDFAEVKKTASLDSEKLKYRRAYDVGLQAQDKGLIGPTRSDLNAYVDSLVTFNDSAFESTRRVIANYSKKQGALPVVTASANEADLSSTLADQPTNITDQLSVLWKK